VPRPARVGARRTRPSSPATHTPRGHDAASPIARCIHSELITRPFSWAYSF